MAIKREIIEGPQLQGADEKIAYLITTTPWASTPAITAATATKAYDVTNGARTDVTATVLTGVTSVLADVITTPLVQTLTAGRTYRVEVLFTSGGNTFELYFIVQAEY